MTELRIEARRLDDPEVSDLLEEIQRFYLQRYGSRDEDVTPPEKFEAPNGTFLVGYLGGEPVACGGWRRLAADTVEIKRMWVSERCRGKGLARTLLEELESTAAAAGAERVVLNTGYLQPEAIALYESSGFQRTDERYGHYADQTGAYFFAKALDR